MQQVEAILKRKRASQFQRGLSARNQYQMHKRANLTCLPVDLLRCIERNSYEMRSLNNCRELVDAGGYHMDWLSSWR